MFRIQIRIAAAIVLIASTMFAAPPLMAGETTDQLNKALSHMDRWLGRSDQGPGWDRYLRRDDLRAEVAKGDAASRQTVSEILAKYQSGVDGLEDYHFADVAKALAAWQETLLPSAGELSALAQSASGEFQSMTEADVAAAKTALAASTEALGAWLDRHGENGQAWKTFLQFSDLEAALAADETDPVAFEKVSRKFTADEDGLEMPQYTAVRDGLRKFVDTYQAANNPNVKKQYEQQTAVLAKLLEKGPIQADYREREAIGQRLAFFERMGQADTLVRAVRGHHSYPNLSGYVTEKVIALGSSYEVNETKKGIRENILGTSLTIDAETTAQVSADVIPNDDRAMFQLTLSGVITSDAVGYNRGVTIWTKGTSDFTARKSFYIDENGVSADRATAKARTKTKVTGLAAKRRIIERIAWRKVGKQKGAAERAGARKTEQRVSTEMDREVSEMLEDSKRQFNEGFRDPLVRRAAYPEVMDFRSTDDLIRLNMLQASASQLGAPTPMPELVVENDMAVRLHESLINNFASTLYAGRTLTSEEVEKESKNSAFLKNLQKKQEEKRKARGEEKDPAADQPWAITFAKRHPVTVVFQDGGVRFTIRGTRFEGDGPVQERAMSIWAVYKFELADNQGLKLVLQEWDVVPTSVENGGRIKPADEPLRQKLKTRFGKLLKDVELDPLEMPGQFARAGKFAYKKVSSEGGWFSLALDQIPGTDFNADRMARAPQADAESDNAEATQAN